MSLAELCLQDSGWIDGACVVVQVWRGGRDTGLGVEGWSATVPVPASNLLEACSDPSEARTPADADCSVGDSIVAIQSCWSELKDPHALIDRTRPRALLLREALVSAFNDCLRKAK